MESRKDSDLVGRAVKQRWPIPDEIRPAIINQLSKLATDPVEDGRTQIAASQVIVQMDRLNLEDEKRQDDAPGTQVNVSVGVQIAALDSLSDSELLQYIDEAKRSLASSTPGEPGEDTTAMVPELPATETA